MEIVDVNVKNLSEFDIENDLYHDTLWENMFDDGEYTDDGCNEAVGFIYSNACHAEVYGNSMDVRWIKDNSDNLRLAMVANDLVNNLMGTEQKKIITEEKSGKHYHSCSLQNYPSGKYGVIIDGCQKFLSECKEETLAYMKGVLTGLDIERKD